MRTRLRLRLRLGDGLGAWLFWMPLTHPSASLLAHLPCLAICLPVYLSQELATELHVRMDA